MSKKHTIDEYGELKYALGRLRGFFLFTDFSKTELLIMDLEKLEEYVDKKFTGESRYDKN